VRYGGGAEKQHTENGFKKTEQIKRRFIVVFVNGYFPARMLNTFVFHVGSFLIVKGKRNLRKYVDKIKLFVNYFYF
jgi:uncharacterized FAD-dependent dehydrogenase